METRRLIHEKNDTEMTEKEIKKNELEWMYNEPPGLKKQLDIAKQKADDKKRRKEWKKALDGMSKEERRLAEKEMESGLTIAERNAFRFEFNKHRSRR